MKKHFISIMCIFLLMMFCFSILVPLQTLNGLEDNFLVNFEDVESANKNRIFGAFIKSELNEKERSVGADKKKQGEIVFKLFGFIPIKKVNVNLASEEEFYVGGVPIGLEINTDGAMVVSDENNCLNEGDIITQINGQEVESIDEIPEMLQKKQGQAELKILRKNKELKTLVNTLKDSESGRYKLGVWVKDDVTGVGTLTFVNKNSHRYGALGHPIVENNSGNVVPVSSGKVYECNLIGINKGKRNAPGELRCVFASTAKSKGTIEDNNQFGINGVLNDFSGLVDENLTARLGGRLGVKLGKATIVSSISGIREEYEIEIIKASYQKNAHDKSMVFRVKDKRLLQMTGGIVQGMSGSPIMQNGKIIGAVTHVFMNDPTKGYAVYSDWML